MARNGTAMRIQRDELRGRGGLCDFLRDEGRPKVGLLGPYEGSRCPPVPCMRNAILGDPSGNRLRVNADVLSYLTRAVKARCAGSY